MESLAIVALSGSAMAAGGAVIAVCLSAGDGWALGGGLGRTLSSILLCLVCVASLQAIAVEGVLLASLVGIFGHDSPSTTDSDRLRWMAGPFLVLAAATAAAVAAAWLWGRPWGRHASFPIASTLGALAWWAWTGRGG